MGFVLSGKPRGGGGSLPDYTQFGVYSGNVVSVPVIGGATHLTWDSLGSGQPILDLSDPENPTVATGGIYAVTAVVALIEAMDAGKGFQANLHLDFLNEDFVSEATATGPLVDGERILVSMSLTTYVPTDGVIAATVILPDDSAARDFLLREACIQRIL